MKVMWTTSALLCFAFTITSVSANRLTEQSSEKMRLAGETIGKHFLEKWSKDRPEPYIRHMPVCFGEERNWAVTKQFIGSLLETKTLSPTAKILFQVSNKDDMPSCRILNSSGTISDRFYCEQAIWDAAPFPQFWPVGSIELGANTKNDNKHDCRGLYLKLSPKSLSNAAVIHVIPISINAYFRRPETFTEDELHSPQNLAALALTEKDEVRLNAFRRDWITFMSQEGKTRQDILSFAALLLDRYHGLFKLLG